jgi:hypothetical protein
MSDDRPSEVLGSLPRTRPHRRSQKRAAAQAQAQAVAGDTSPRSERSDRVRAPAGKATRAASTGKSAKRAASPPPSGRRSRASAGAAEVKSGPPAVDKPPTATTRKSQQLRQPAQPGGTPSAPRSRRPAGSGADILGTAVQAAAELAEIGLTVSARAIRSAISRLPRP